MTVVAHPEILTSLSSIREDVKRQVAGLDRYRALKAIEQTIADFPTLEDVSQSLADIRDRVQRQLDETREYRALRTIERIMPELSDVLELLKDRAKSESESISSDAKAGEAHAGEGTHEQAAAMFAPPPAPETRAPQGFEVVAFVESTELEVEPAAPQSQFFAEETATRLSEPEGEIANESHLTEPESEFGPPSRPGAVPSLADSVAQLMAQSIAPPPREAHAPQHQSHERGDAVPAHSERAA